MSKGLFICHEGGDGSGKGTQHELTGQSLEAMVKQVLRLDFPQYATETGEIISSMMNNEFGDPTKIHPKLASLPFALDRYTAKPAIANALDAGHVVAANRFTASNMAHQGAKYETSEERIDFFRWLHHTEHDILGIPEPDMHFVLHVPADVARRRILQKTARGYTTLTLDGHEADLAYQKRAEATYLDLAVAFPYRFTVIECVVEDYEKTPDEIHAEIWTHVERMVV